MAQHRTSTIRHDIARDTNEPGLWAVPCLGFIKWVWHNKNRHGTTRSTVNTEINGTGWGGTSSHMFLKSCVYEIAQMFSFHI